MVVMEAALAGEMEPAVADTRSYLVEVFPKTILLDVLGGSINIGCKKQGSFCQAVFVWCSPLHNITIVLQNDRAKRH